MTTHKLLAIFAAALGGAALIPGIGAIPATILGILSTATVASSAAFAHGADKQAAATAAVTAAAVKALAAMPASHPAKAILQDVLAAADAPEPQV